MTANEITLAEFFQLPKQMVISTSQRNYNWNEEHHRKLWDDVIRIARDESIAGHSMGTIICIEHGILPKAHIPRFLLLDGRQRLVAVSLLLAALNKKGCRHVDQKAESYFGKIHDLFLFNKDETGELHYKLLVEGNDQKTFQAILNGKNTLPSNSSWFTTTSSFFEGMIDKTHVDPDLVAKGLAKLAIIPVSTDQYYEKPGQVYEEITSTGLDETQTSLIRNWLKLLRTP